MAEKVLPTISPIQKPDDSIKWFAMRVTYRREFAVRDVLKEKGVEVFVPMRYVQKKGMKGHKKVLVPVVSSLIFVHERQSVIQRMKMNIPHLQYIVDKNRKKIVVPEDQMKHFVAACATYNESLTFFEPSELKLEKGTKVKIIGGDFEGYEGVLVKIKGKRKRRVVIAIEGVIAVAMVSIHPDLIVPIQ